MKNFITGSALLGSLLLCGQGMASVLPSLDVAFQMTEGVADQHSSLQARCAYFVRYLDYTETTVYSEASVQVAVTQMDKGFHVHSEAPLHVSSPLFKHMLSKESLGCSVKLPLKVKDAEGLETDRKVTFYFSGSEEQNLAELLKLAETPLKLDPTLKSPKPIEL